MESSGKFGLKLKITKSVYFQNGIEHHVDTPYLKFENNGNVSLDGSDEVGEFSFSGHVENDYLFLKKHYHGKHTVFYVGKLEKNKLNLAYDFVGHFDDLKAKVNNGEFMALMEFKANLYNLYLDGNHEKDNNIFLAQSSGKENKFKGLGLIKDKLTKVILKRKHDNKGKLKLKYPESEASMKITIDDASNNIYIDTDEEKGNNYALRINKCIYIKEGVEYNLHMPYLFFQRNGHFSGDFVDNNGPFTIKGHLENQYVFMKKSYSDKIFVHYCGKIVGSRWNLAYDFEGAYNELKEKVNKNDIMMYLDNDNILYTFLSEGKEIQRHFFFLKKDSKGFRGFAEMDGRLNIVVLKVKGEGKGKLKLKKGFRVKYNSVNINDSEFLIEPNY